MLSTNSKQMTVDLRSFCYNEVVQEIEVEDKCGLFL